MGAQTEGMPSHAARAMSGPGIRDEIRDGDGDDAEAVAVVRTGTIGTQARRLEQLSQELHERLDKLEARLQLALLPGEGEKGTTVADDRDRDASCQLAGDMLSTVARFEAAMVRLIMLTGRVDV